MHIDYASLLLKTYQWFPIALRINSKLLKQHETPCMSWVGLAYPSSFISHHLAIVYPSANLNHLKLPQ